MLLLAKLRKKTVLFFLPTRKSHWGKDRGRSKARRHAECPAGKRREEGRKPLLRRGLTVPPSQRGVPRLSLGNAGHPRHTRPPGRDPLSPWGGRGCCGDQTCGEIDILLLGATEI